MRINRGVNALPPACRAGWCAGALAAAGEAADPRHPTHTLAAAGCSGEPCGAGGSCSLLDPAAAGGGYGCTCRAGYYAATAALGGALTCAGAYQQRAVALVAMPAWYGSLLDDD